jgi:cbb3-type cytochrome oxidase subunit 3
MNPLFRSAAESLETGWLLGTMTVLFLTFFLVVSLRLLSRGTRDEMEAAALLPFEDHDHPHRLSRENR